MNEKCILNITKTVKVVSKYKRLESVYNIDIHFIVLPNSLTSRKRAFAAKSPTNVQGHCLKMPNECGVRRP